MNLRVALLAIGYTALLIYASLHPFTGWETAGVDKFGFLTGSWPSVAPRIDNYVNVLAYLPLGLLIALCLQGRGSFALRVIVATLGGLTLSFSMEYLQQYLPRRVASNADLATNACGALVGALLSSVFDRVRAPGRTLARWRDHWVKPGAQFSLGLIVLAAWALSQWLPGLPSFSVAALREGLSPAWHTAQDLSRFDVVQWGRYALYLSGLALLAKTLANPGRPAFGAFFLFVAVVFAYKAAVMDRQLSLEAVAGAFTAVLLGGAWLALRLKTVATVAALFILGGLVCAHFLPAPGSAQHLSNWAPLRGPIDHPTLGLGSVLEILWPPAALGYLARIAASPESRRTVAWGGGAALGMFIVGVDWQDQPVPIATGLLMAATWTVFGSVFSAPAAAGASQPPLVNKRLPSALMQTWVLGAILALSYADVAAAESGRAPLRVGPQHALKMPSEAAKVARDGDLVEIEADVYAGDATVWTQNHLTLRGVGGLAHLRADGAHAEGKAIWVIKGLHTTVENIEFSGAKVADRNGAGIRGEGAGLIVRNCFFHHNENAILAAPNADSDIVLEHSEFAHNGRPDGNNHNIYIGRVRSFSLRDSYVHGAVGGHNVKSRAIANTIANNHISNGGEGRSSYALDIPDGGVASVTGNFIRHGRASENRAIVAYGAEGLKNALNELDFVENTVVNDDPSGGRFVFIRRGASAARITSNRFVGRGELLAGPGELRNNTHTADVQAVSVSAPR